MKLSTAVVSATAALVVGGGLVAAQAAANPAGPRPSAPTATPSTVPSDAARGARIGWFYRALTDQQRACLADAGVQRPSGTLTDAQRTELAAKVRAALDGCGVALPERLADRPRLGFAWAALTPEQQQCLADVELTRPVGRLTDAQRAAVKQSVQDAAKACGIGRQPR